MSRKPAGWWEGSALGALWAEKMNGSVNWLALEGKKEREESKPLISRVCDSGGASETRSRAVNANSWLFQVARVSPHEPRRHI